MTRDPQRPESKTPAFFKRTFFSSKIASKNFGVGPQHATRVWTQWVGELSKHMIPEKEGYWDHDLPFA